MSLSNDILNWVLSISLVVNGVLFMFWNETRKYTKFYRQKYFDLLNKWTVLELQRVLNINEQAKLVDEVLKYCTPYMDQMWASRIVGMLLKVDFRDADQALTKFREGKKNE